MKCNICGKVAEPQTVNESVEKYKLILCKEHLESYNKVEFWGKEISGGRVIK